MKMGLAGRHAEQESPAERERHEDRELVAAASGSLGNGSGNGKEKTSRETPVHTKRSETIHLDEPQAVSSPVSPVSSRG